MVLEVSMASSVSRHLVRRALPVVMFTAVLLAGSAGMVLAQAVGSQEAASAKTWIGREAEFEAYLRSAEITEIKDIGTGITKPQRCRLAPGGLAGSFAWKTIQPGRYRGFWESYKSEIAAYELDKALGLGMIPPTVVRRVNHTPGAAIMWVSPVKSFKDLGGPPTPPPAELQRWNQQVARAKMFDNLIGNIDPNLGNWLVDPAWNLILIDHTRAFTTGTGMVHQLQGIDPELWERIRQLTESSLQASIGEWVGRAEMRAILKRRDRMAEAIAAVGTSAMP
jgi:hypothetical protein